MTPAAASTHPRLVIAGVRSGAGKTTFTCAILAAFRRRGLTLAPFKAGPDYLDPTYLTRAAAAPCRTLDTWMLSPQTVQTLFARIAGGVDVAIVEGVMGLYDGRTGGPAGEGEEEGSTGHLAKLLDAPVLLVVDATGAARTLAAIVLGCQRFDPAVRIAGILLSGVSSPRHLQAVGGPIQRVTGLPVLGHLPRRDDLAVPSRHLGLIPAAEHGVDDAFFDRLALQAEETVDLDAILTLAQHAPPLPNAAPPPGPSHLFPQAQTFHPPGPGHRSLRPAHRPARPTVRIALALDDAFSFYYEDSLDVLRAHGAEFLPFSPLKDDSLPPGTEAMYIGGGFPEVFAAQLAANAPILAAVHRAAQSGLPIYAECGGLMYLCQGIVDKSGARHRMAAVIPRWSHMGQRRAALGYRVATARRPTLLSPAGHTVRGHEFHWSTLDSPPTPAEAAYDLATADGAPAGLEGFVAGPNGNVLASYLHLHFAADPLVTTTFLDAASRRPT